MKTYKIVHLTSVHQRYDTRIFIKMCNSLAKHGFSTNLIVADGKGDETLNNVSIIDIGAKTGGRMSRMTRTVTKVYKKALELNADIYHLHDPELIPIGLKLKKMGKVVVFDAHEDLPKQLLSKPYLNKFLLFIISKSFALYEQWACKKFNAVISATSAINEKFKKINSHALTINNFPILGELSIIADNQSKRDKVIFVGGMSKIRGITQLIEAADAVKNNILLVGNISPPEYRQQLESMPGWRNVESVGQKNRQEVADILATSFAGIVTYLPLPNHVDAQPNKMFEYMSAGVPVIASHYPLWKDIIEGSECGICVDPENPTAIADAIKYLANNSDVVTEMSKNGKKAVEDKYNWDSESEKLISLYQGLLSQ